MRLPFVVMVCSVALLVSACSPDARAPGGSSTDEPAESVIPFASSTIPTCATIEWISAPAERYRDSPIYVANEQPTEEIRAWAADQPGFEELWIDRDRLGWITVAFSTDADARQADLERLFPDVGVVAVEVDWSLADLEQLQRRIGEELDPIFAPSSWISVQQGVVGIGLGVLEPERVAAIEARFAGEPVCIEGADPADMPAEGPQPQQGDGWRLLADEQGAGQPYRTGLASDQLSYERLWADVGLSSDPPPVDFESEVVIWFGAVYGSSCPNLRLDDVVVDAVRTLVHAEIVLVDPPSACSGDANPRAYLVALERTKLPAGPFAIQLGADDPPAGVPEERTLVDVDLSQPGAVAGLGDVGGDPLLPEPEINESGAIVEPGFPAPYRLSVHCGIEWLGHVNEIAWRTDVPADPLDFVPPEWEPSVRGESIDLSILLQTDPEPVIEATANGHTIVYRATAEELPGCD
ncbi:MAG: hypothetical protein ACR2GO_06115 [Candidatus Limnocylindria bacterium]